MESLIPLFIGLFALVVIVWVGRLAIRKFQESIHEEAAEGIEAVHSMLGSLRKSLENGDISEIEYRTIKSELMDRLQESAQSKD